MTCHIGTLYFYNRIFFLYYFYNIVRYAIRNVYCQQDRYADLHMFDAGVELLYIIKHFFSSVTSCIYDSSSQG